MSIRQNPFIRDAATGKRITRWYLAIPLFLVFVLVVNIGLALLLTATWPAAPGSGMSQLREGVTSVVPILVVFAWVVWFEGRRIPTLGFHQPRRGVVTLLLGIVVGLAMISVPILMLWATGVYQSATPAPSSSTGFSALPLVLLLALTVVVQGSNEEILTRGFLFQSLGLQIPGWLAILLPALLFTVVHGITDPLTFITIFGFGLFATFVVLQQKSLWLICGIHAGWNWAMGNVYGIAVSGTPPKTNALFNLESSPDAASWLTGGDNGTEGSLLATCMIITATILVFLAWRRRDSSPGSDDTAPQLDAATRAAEEPASRPAKPVYRSTTDN